MLAGHKGLGSQVGKYGADEWLGLLDHCLQVLVCQKNLVVLFGCGYFKKVVELGKRSLILPLYKPTSFVIACTTQTKISAIGS